MFKNFTVLIFIIQVFLVISCKEKVETTIDDEPSMAQESSLTLNEAQTEIAKIQLANLSRLPMGNTITLLGKIEAMPSQKSTVSSIHEGFIKDVKWMPGMTVKKGQVLFTVENKELIQLQQDYLTAKNLLYYATLDFDRQKELVKNQAASEKAFQQAEEKVRQQEIFTKSLTQKLKYFGINTENLTTENLRNFAVVYAPISGSITQVSINNGAYVHTGDELMTIVDSPSARWVCKAFEKDLIQLSVGQKVFISLTNNKSKIYSGRIEYIVKNIEDEGYAQVICKPDQPISNGFVGMMINATIESQSKEAWSIPDKAIVNFEGKEFIFFEKAESTYEIFEIIKGIHENGFTEIVNFESIMDKRIVVEGAYTLLMKMKNVSEE
jgi:cobalt-zinc-cadmium efflux system membrane fusion protein